MRHCGTLFVVVLTSSLFCWAQPTPTRYQLTTDISATVASVTVEDTDVVEYTGSSGSWSVVSALSTVLPNGVGVDAVHCWANGDVVFSTDSSVTFSGGSADDEDLLLYSGGALTLLWDGSAAGLPSTVDLDAVAVLTTSPLSILLSIDTSAMVSGIPCTDDDIIAYSAGAGFSVLLAGSSWLAGEEDRADVDALAMVGSLTDLHVSLDVTAEPVAGLIADDEQLLLVSGGVASSVLPFPAIPTEADVDGFDVQLAPTLATAATSFAIVNTATAVTWTVTYTDLDSDPPAAGSPALVIDGGAAVAMSASSGCGVPLCDGIVANGEQYEHTSTVAYGAAHAYSITASDGLDGTGPATGTTPTYVSDPADADGDTDIDAGDVAWILIEHHDSNGGSDLDLVRGGVWTASWGGADADSDHQVGTSDLPAAVAVIF
jgi:hypothetical protein